MKPSKILLTIVLISVITFVTRAQNILVTMKSGEEHNINYKNHSISGRGIETNNGVLMDYNEVLSISTSDYNAYDRAFRMVERSGNQSIEIYFTGDKSIHAQELEKLQQRRTGAHGARAAGGILAIIGAISGDRDLYNAGMVTYGVGTIAKDINTEKTLETQNQMLNELYENQNKQETKEEKYRREYGNENVDAIIALMEKDHNRAKALANAGETSKDANHRLSAMYIKAIIAVDMNDQEEADKAYDKLVIFDPEIADKEQAAEETKYLVEDINNL